MSLIRAKEYLKKFNLDQEIITFSSSSATVELASINLGCKMGEIAKSLSFKLKDRTILIVVAGDKKIDNAKYKAFFNEKAQMLKYDEVEEKIGHKVGGVCPFGVNSDVDIYLDVSLKAYNYVYPACGEENNAIKIGVKELEKIINYKAWCDVCK